MKERLKADQERDQAAIDGFDSRFQTERERALKRIADAELRLRQDKLGAAELARVEAERGGDARAVQMGVFPETNAPKPGAN